MKDYSPKSQEATLLEQLQSEVGSTPQTISEITEAAHSAGKVIQFSFVNISELNKIEEVKQRIEEEKQLADSGLLQALFDSDFCEKDDDEKQVEDIEFYEIDYSGKTFAKDEEGETDSLDYENWEIVSLNDKEMIFMAGGDWQMPSYVKLGVTKGGRLTVIDCISTQDEPNHEYTDMKNLDRDEIVYIINNRPNA